MKKYILPLLFAGLIACGDIPREAEALQYGADVNRGECVAGYNRVAPGLCQRGSISVLVFNSSSFNTCTSLNIPEIPSNAKQLLLITTLRPTALNAVGVRSMDVLYHVNNTCSTANNSVSFNVMEFVPMSVGTFIAQVSIPSTVLYSSSIGGTAYISTLGNSGTYIIAIQGYTD